MFRLSNDDDIPKLRMLWKKCFDADSVFLDLFFGKGYGLTRTYVMETEAGLVSALSIFPIKYAGHNGGYVYGVCTHPEHRGHRHAVSLLSYAEEQLLDKEIDFMILRPASPTLFDYYIKQGYSTTIWRDIKKISLPLIPAEIALEPLCGRSMFTARACQCRNGLLFEWSPEMCKYLLSYVEYCKGKACRINYGEGYIICSCRINYGEGYIICYPDSEDNGIIVCEEYGDNFDSGHGHSLIPYWIKGIYPNSSTAIISTPAENEKEAHMLCKTRLDIFSGKHPLFTFTME